MPDENKKISKSLLEIYPKIKKYDGRKEGVLNGRLVAFYKNGSALYGGKSELTTNYGVSQQVTLTASFEMNGSSDYVELYGLVDNVGGSSKFESDYSGTNRSTFFGSYKLIGV